MLYKLRLKLSMLLFRWGKIIHPDIARLSKEIKIQQELLGMAGILIKENIQR